MIKSSVYSVLPYLRTFLTLVIFSILFSCSREKPSTQNPVKEFEGVVTYTTLLESKTEKRSTEELQSMFGDTMKFYYRSGDYRMSYNGNDLQDIYYLKKENSQFTIRKGIDTLLVSPSNYEKRKLISSEMPPDSLTLLNRRCFKLVNDFGRYKHHYWFAPELYCNPSHFEKYKFSALDLVYKKTRSVSLKYMFEASSFNQTHTAIKIEEKAIPDSVFDLPDFPRKKF